MHFGGGARSPGEGIIRSSFGLARAGISRLLVAMLDAVLMAVMRVASAFARPTSKGRRTRRRADQSDRRVEGAELFRAVPELAQQSSCAR
jgi:hypothetical protein